MGAMERMRDELGRAGRRGRRILTPDGVVSPMDRNPTVEVAAAVIADCLADSRASRRGEHPAVPADPLVDAGMQAAAAGRPLSTSVRDTA